MKISILVFSVLLLNSCTDEKSFSNYETKDSNKSVNEIEQNIIVVNQGIPSASTATIDVISEDYNFQINKIYQRIYNSRIGTKLQSIGFNDNKAYLMVSNDNKIVVTNFNSFDSQLVIEKDINNPRYIAFNSEKAYVTNWGESSCQSDDYVAVMDLKTNAVTKKIKVREGPEQMVIKDGFLFVTHKGGLNIKGKAVSVIDLITNEVVKEIVVSFLPDEILVLPSGNILVLCEGLKKSDRNPIEKPACLVLINHKSFETKVIELKNIFPTLLVNQGSTLYFNNDKYICSLEDSAIDKTPKKILHTNIVNPSALAINNDMLYISCSKGAGGGYLYVYDLYGFKLLKTLKVGLFPSKIYFN